MDDAWLEFSKVAVAHLLAVASPGPDFAIVLKQSVVHGRRVALWTSVGVGTAILVHVSYSLLGLGVLVRQSEAWFTGLKYAGAVYLAWLGVQSLRSRPRPEAGDNEILAAPAAAARGAFATGFLTNALNVKAALFFISLFAVIVDPHTSRWVQAGYGAWMALATTAWFCLVALLFTRREVRRRFLRYGHWIDRALGIVFLALAVGLARATLR